MGEIINSRIRKKDKIMGDGKRGIATSIVCVCVSVCGKR